MRRWSMSLELLPAFFVLCLDGEIHAQEAPATNGTIRGRVLDTESQTPIGYIEASLLETSFRVMGDKEGRFTLSDVPPGNYSLRVIRVGFEGVVREGVVVEAGATVDLTLSMTRKYAQLKAVTVTPGAYSIMKTSSTARQTLSREDIESVPQLGEDVFRAVSRLPGLSSGDYSAHFSIRGGRHDETLILLDGLELYEPYHLKDFAEGAISIVDVETIDGVQLLTGGFPAQYGNKRSGVFDITSRTAERDKGRYGLGVSFMNARGMARGPIGAGGTWLASARSGYMDLVFGMINQDELPSPRYHDFFGKVEVDIHPSHRLSFDVLYAGDKYTFDAGSTAGFADSIITREEAENHYSNAYAWTTLRSTFGSRTVVRSMMSGSLVTRERDGSEGAVNQVSPFYTVHNERDMSIFGLKQDWTVGITDGYLLTYGVDYRYFDMSDRYVSVVNQDPEDPTAPPAGTYPVTTLSRIDNSGNRLGAYLSNRVRPTKRLTMDLGARYDGTSYTDDSDWSPRVSAAYGLGDRTTVRAGWGYYRQMQGIDEVAALNSNNQYFPSELSEQWTAGLERLWENGSRVRVEGYYKEGSHLRPVYRNWKGGVDTFPEVNEDRILVYPLSMDVRGFELSGDHRFGEKLAGRASYAYSRGREVIDRMDNINDPAVPLVFDREHAIPQDQRHAVNLDLTYKWRKLWTINGSMAYHSGWPATHEELVNVVNEDGNPDTAVRPIKIYGEQLPSYMRFDVRATRRWNTSHGDFRAFLELVNMTNHENVFGYDYFREFDAAHNIVLTKEDEAWFTILPSLGIAWTATF